MTSTEFTIEEILALARGFGLGEPVFLAGGPFETWSEEVRSEVDEIGRRSLAARSVVNVDDSGALLAPEILRTLFETLATPEAMVRISNVDDSGFRLVIYLVDQRWCAGARLTRLGNYDFTLFEASRLREAVLEVLDLRSTTTPNDAEKIEIPESTFREMVIDRQLHPHDAPDLFFRRSGLDRSVGERLLPMMGVGAVGWTVEVLVRDPSTRRLDGSLTTWVASDDQLWMVDGSADGVVCYQNVGGLEIAASIDEGLPPALRLSLEGIGRADEA